MFGTYHFELLTQSRWWVILGSVAGVVLLVYAFLAWRAVSSQLTAAGRTSAPHMKRSKAWMAGWSGFGTLAITALLGWLEPQFTGEAARRFSFVIFGFLLTLLAWAVILFYSTVHGALLRSRLLALSSLRIAGILALVLLLFRPVVAIVRGPAATKPELALIIDASASMGYNDAANQPNRYRQSALALPNTLVPRLRSSSSLKLSAYDGTHTAALNSADDFDTILPNGDVTDLGAALSLPSNAAATVLFSDGIHNGAQTIDAELA